MEKKTVILYQHCYKDGKITVEHIECIEKPKTYVRKDNRYFAGYFCTFSKNKLDTICWCGNYLYSLSKDVERFKSKLIEDQEQTVRAIEERLNEERQTLSDMVNANEQNDNK